MCIIKKSMKLERLRLYGKILFLPLKNNLKSSNVAIAPRVKMVYFLYPMLNCVPRKFWSEWWRLRGPLPRVTYWKNPSNLKMFSPQQQTNLNKPSLSSKGWMEWGPTIIYSEKREVVPKTRIFWAHRGQKRSNYGPSQKLDKVVRNN